jgi:hypothetical protein
MPKTGVRIVATLIMTRGMASMVGAVHGGGGEKEIQKLTIVRTTEYESDNQPTFVVRTGAKKR